jgi:predicted membrane chloride channel (bestrophin family)
MDWIDLAQDRDQWGALVDTIMNLSRWVATQLAASQDGLTLMKLVSGPTFHKILLV